MLFAVISFFFHIILHEGGHLIGGLISGYKFVSFRVGNLILVKQDGKLRLKKTTVVGTGGQCLMSPLQCEPEKCPFIIYLISGGLINIIVGAIFAVIAYFVGGTAAVLLNIIAFTDIGFGISNLFSAKIYGTVNDGYNVFISLPRNPSERAAQYCMLIAHEVFSNNDSTTALPEYIRKRIMEFDYGDLSNVSVTNLLLYKANILMELGRDDEVKQILKRVPESGDVLPIFKMEASCELLYFEIMGECNPVKINKIGDKKLMDYIKQTSLYPSRQRLMYAYNLIYKKDGQKAEKSYEALLKTAQTHPIKTEIALKLKEAEKIKKYYESLKNGLHEKGNKRMNVLVVGGGGREHAIIVALSKSARVDKIYAAPGNGGISKYAECFPVKATDLDGMVKLAEELKPDYVFVAPDDPLVMGMVDRLNEKGFKTFGPKANAAILEGSKVFSKALMKKYNIPTAAYETFTDADKAIEYLKAQNSYPAVIKCDGLALGKGVIIAQNEQEAVAAVSSMLLDGKFGASGSEIVIEEFMTGPELTVLAFTDGKTVKPMISSMDHKRAYDNDEGLNTGGMGTIAPNPFYTEEKQKECMEKIFLPTVKAMQSEGRPFKGCLYFGLMLTPSGAKVVEYNCRFGDPETQVVLPLLETDIMDIIEAVWEERLSELEIKWSDKACACVVMASGGYPEKYETGKKISGLDQDGQCGGAFVYHAGTKCEDGKFYTAGGRVLGVTATGDTLKNALDKAYEAVGTIGFEKAHYRKDIGKKAL